MFKGVETENITMDLLITSALRMFYSCKGTFGTMTSMLIRQSVD